ncbi:hypothetical protein PHMEG_00011774 [Phytophthora megakarya]|uniref:Uncharacterized protein n=1 Tax=Phytophthora megakarya TaxID=4795 RepID=A0A225WAF0_9STRA|nr:hypothetical protein PHMEG_00011774 [Phytophthora megakarya]
MAAIRRGDWRNGSGSLQDPGKLFFLIPAAECVRLVNGETDKNERATDTDIGGKPAGRVPRPAGEHPRPPMSKLPSKPPMGKLAAYTQMLEKEMAAQDAQKTNARPVASSSPKKVSKKEAARIAKGYKIAKES